MPATITAAGNPSRYTIRFPLTAGTLLPGPKVPALAGNRLVYRDGLPAAAEIAGKPHVWLDLEPQASLELRTRLIRH